jgi:hypothetical protein
LVGGAIEEVSGMARGFRLIPLHKVSTRIMWRRWAFISSVVIDSTDRVSLNAERRAIVTAGSGVVGCSSLAPYRNCLASRHFLRISLDLHRQTRTKTRFQQNTRINQVQTMTRARKVSECLCKFNSPITVLYIYVAPLRTACSFF